MKTLAEIRASVGRYAEAEQLYLQILTIDRKALGRNHPHYAVDLNNLALLYRATGRVKEAQPMLERAVAIVQKTARRAGGDLRDGHR